MTIIPQMTLIKAMVGMRLPSEKYRRREGRPPSSKYFEGDKTAEAAGDERSETTGVAPREPSRKGQSADCGERSAGSSHKTRAGQCPLDWQCGAHQREEGGGEWEARRWRQPMGASGKGYVVATGNI